MRALGVTLRSVQNRILGSLWFRVSSDFHYDFISVEMLESSENLLIKVITYV